MTDKATMPEVICEGCRTISVPAKHYHALADKADKHDSLAAVAEGMSNAAALICMGYSNLDGQVELEKALTSYNALMKGSAADGGGESKPVCLHPRTHRSPNGNYCSMCDGVL